MAKRVRKGRSRAALTDEEMKMAETHHSSIKNTGRHFSDEDGPC